MAQHVSVVDKNTAEYWTFVAYFEKSPHKATTIEVMSMLTRWANDYAQTIHQITTEIAKGNLTIRLEDFEDFERLQKMVSSADIQLAKWQEARKYAILCGYKDVPQKLSDYLW